MANLGIQAGLPGHEIAVNRKAYAIGVDYGTNSVRALVTDLRDGRELSTAIHNYATGQDGILLDPINPNLAGAR